MTTIEIVSTILNMLFIAVMIWWVIRQMILNSMMSSIIKTTATQVTLLSKDIKLLKKVVGYEDLAELDLSSALEEITKPKQ